MVSEEESVNYDKIKSETPSPIYPPLEQSKFPQEDIMEDFTLSPSSKQNSIMLRTLDEFQSKSGKNFGSMSMDEFLNNIWSSVEGDQLSLQSNHSHEPTIDSTLVNQSTSPKQVSLSIPSPLCKKTVDEVWFEIQKNQPQQQNLRNVSSRESLQRQQTLAEMTLEDFLVKAGVVQEASVLSPQPRKIESSHDDIGRYPNDNSCLEANIRMGCASSLGYSDRQNLGNNMPNNYEFTPYQMDTQSNNHRGESSNNYNNEDGGGAMESNRRKSKKGRSSDGPTEEAIERRQRRMIKNRESAARSRARKQAYTVELELELTQLKEENEKLKQTVAEVENKRKHELLVRRLYTTKAQKIAEKMRTIRRSMSMNW